MFLCSIALTNVRSIKSLKLDFDSPGGGQRKWTILLGENGCGKSTVLRAIGLVLAGSEGMLRLLQKPESWIRNGASSCKIEVVIGTAKEERRTVALVIERGLSVPAILTKNKKSLLQLDNAIAHSDHNYFVAGYGIGRRPATPGARPSAEERWEGPDRASSVSSLFNLECPLISLERWAIDLDYVEGRSGLAVVKKTLAKLLPGMTLNKIDKRAKSLIFDTVDGPVPFSELSDGYQIMASWCGDLLYRITQTFPKNRNPMSARGVLLIDELDMHLHPVWRRRLVEFLDQTFPNLQIVATTHSALTAQQCASGELYVIRRQGKLNLPALIPFVGEPRKMMLHQLLMSPMFGLATLDSVEIEKAKGHVREISKKDAEKRTAKETSVLKVSKETLKDAPDWDAVPEFEKVRIGVLQSVQRELLGGGSSGEVSSIKLGSRLRALGVKK